MCNFGIVEILGGGCAQDPRPAADIVALTGIALGAFMTASSLPGFVSLLVEGEAEDMRFFCPPKDVCSSPSILLKRSSISLSPASSLIPGSL